LTAHFDPRRLHHWVAFGFGSGLVALAPGTFGTLAAMPLYWLVSGLPLVVYGALVLVLAGLGVWACGRTARELGDSDPGAIVWDEVVGYLVTMTALPVSWGWALAGFALFRLLDIAKPWPIRWLDRRIHGGWGIMLDDLAAGLIACLLLHALAHALG
jgi:phosphatidylglycerophosphatase A